MVLKLKYIHVPYIATSELVNTTLLTAPLVAAQASKTFLVPSTAGLITSISSVGLDAGNGDATCKTYVQSLTALKFLTNNHFKTSRFKILTLYVYRILETDIQYTCNDNIALG